MTAKTVVLLFGLHNDSRLWIVPNWVKADDVVEVALSTLLVRVFGSGFRWTSSVLPFPLLSVSELCTDAVDADKFSSVVDPLILNRGIVLNYYHNTVFTFVFVLLGQCLDVYDGLKISQFDAFVQWHGELFVRLRIHLKILNEQFFFNFQSRNKICTVDHVDKPE